MNKKIIGLLIIFVILMSIVLINRNEDTIPTYKSNLVCKKSITEDLDGNVITSKSIVYIYLDKDNYVTKAIKQGISNDYSSKSITDDISNLYNTVNGINSNVLVKEGKVILEITYDYEKIDITEIKSKLGYLLSDESIFNSVDNLKVSFDKYKEIELEGYTCK